MKRFPVPAAVVVCLCAAALFAKSETQTRTIYVSAVDKKGVPVADLRATDVVVTEDGQPQAPLTVEHASALMRIALVVDDRGLGVPEVRAGLSSFVEALRGHAEVGAFSSVRPEATVVDFTADTQTLLAGIQQLLPMQTGGQGLSTLTLELAQEYAKRGTARPVMVVVTIDESCNDSSALSASRGAAPITMAGQTIAPPGCPAGAARQFGSATPWQQAVEQIQHGRVTFFGIASRHTAPGDHSPVIDASAEVSGGRVEPVLTDSGIPAALTRIADDLLGQYAVTYNASSAPPQGVRLRVNVKRSGVTVRAPERVGVR
jgi:hypothetical protein